MKDLLGQRIQALLDSEAASTLAGMQRGIEKESLRISGEGKLARTPHPSSLGSALTHPWITTDYSEALLEFITPPSDTLSAPLDFLDRIHRYTYSQIDDELLWVNSMPCVMGEDNDIPLAEYGSSNVGMMKHIYRRGLGLRYGRRMQTIAGIHYNFSFPQAFWQLHQQQEDDQRPLQDFISDRYFDLLRNFQRYSWLLIYLFGASPAVCASFLRGREHQLEERSGHTLYQPMATSLRMSDLGYQNNAQSQLHISYNNLDDYVRTLTDAIKTVDPVYQKLGVKIDGEYQQLNANILQIENEYYSSIRPKRTINSGERPTLALARRGVEYIEIRALDLNPFEPLGINLEQIRFLDIFASYCLLHESPALSETDLADSKRNIRKVVYQGRSPELTLCNWGKGVPLRQWAREKFAQMEPIAELFDRISGGDSYQQALNAQKDKIEHPENTPSARILAELDRNNSSFFTFAMEKAQQHREHFLSHPLDDDTRRDFVEHARQSMEQQQQVEAQDNQSFEEYLAAYFRD